MRSRSFATKLTTLGAQIAIIGGLGVSAVAFGAGLAHAAPGARSPDPAPTPGGGGGRVWEGGWAPFLPYPYSPYPPDDSSDRQGPSGGNTAWPPTSVSWPAGGGSGNTSTSTTPIVMPQDWPAPPEAASPGTE